MYKEGGGNSIICCYIITIFFTSDILFYYRIFKAIFLIIKLNLTISLHDKLDNGIILNY